MTTDGRDRTVSLWLRRIVTAGIVACALVAGCRDEGTSGGERTPRSGPPEEPGAPLVAQKAPGTAAVEGEPRLELEPRTRDVGEVREGRTVTAVYSLRNAGDGVLRIARARPRCRSCMTVKLSRRDVPPGEAARLEVTYEVRDVSGPFARYVVIESNNPSDPSVSVMMAGVAVPEFAVEPAEVDFGEVPSGAGADAEAVLTRNFGGEPVVSQPAEAPDWLDVDVAAEREPGGPVKVTLRVPPGVPPGDYAGEVRLPVNGTVRSELVLKARARVVGAVRLAEDELFFGMVPAGESARKSVVLETEGAELQDVRVLSEAAGLTAELVRGTADRSPRIRVTLPAGGEPGPFSESLKMEAVTDSATERLRLRCYGIRSE
ncbi:MAG: DUF1573 domain-containing protein [Longimicrobiales bacterium]